MKRASLVIVALLAGALSAITQAAPSGVATSYLEHALDLMETHSINRAVIDWDEFRATVFDAARDAQTRRDTYPALRLALHMLGDNHSALIPPARAPANLPASHDATDARDLSPPYPTARLIDGAVGYLRVPGHHGGDPDADLAFADALQTLIYRVDRAEPCGWVVDLRDNPGGNMWPMLAGLQPLLGTGTVGAFRDAAGRSIHWWVNDGAAGAGDEVQAASRYAVALRGGVPPVAVLTGPATASSGEAVAVAFRGRDATRSFGTETFGVSTGNRGFVLEDGALLFVTASRFADRDGNVYGGTIEPDVPVDADGALDAALDWLRRWNACAIPAPS